MNSESLRHLTTSATPAENGGQECGTFPPSPSTAPWRNGEYRPPAGRTLATEAVDTTLDHIRQVLPADDPGEPGRRTTRGEIIDADIEQPRVTAEQMVDETESDPAHLQLALGSAAVESTGSVTFVDGNVIVEMQQS